jgi:hypothetical protein
LDGSKIDANDDVPININHDGAVDGGSASLDGASLDVAIDTAQVSLDAAIDTAPVDTGALDGGLDGSTD